jgi:AsmA protein
MAVRRHKSGHLAMVIAVLALVAFGIGGPIGGGGDRLDLAGMGLVAAPRDRYAITDPMQLQGIPGIRIERGTIALSERHADKILTGEAVSALLASGSAKLVLDGATILVDRDAVGTNESGGDTVAPLAAALGQLAFETLSIRRSALILKHRDGRTETIGDVSAEITNKRKSSLSAKGTIVVRGHKLSLDAFLGLPADKRATASAQRQQPLKLVVKGPMLEASIDGRISGPDSAVLVGHGELSVRSLRDGARWLGLSWPTGPGLADLKIKGPVEWSAQSLSFQKATMQMDGNEAQGTLSISAVGTRPTISGTLALQTLDLTRYIDTWRKDAARSLIDDVMGPGPFALPLVRHIDADIRISANRVRAAGLEMGQSAASLSVKGGKLLADIAEVAYDGARGSGQLMVDTNLSPPRYVVRGRMQTFDLARLTLDNGVVIPLKGRGDVVADVSAAGETSTELLRTLSGRLSLAMPAGGRVGLDLKALLSAAHKQPLNGWQPTARGSTSVDSLHGRLVLSEGVVFTESFNAALGDALITATGGGSLRSGLVDVRVSMAGRPPADRAGQVDPSLPSEALILRGPWNEPSIRAERSLHARQPASSPPDKAP